MTYNELCEFVRNKITVLGEQGKEGFSQELLLEHGYYSSCSMIMRTLDKFFSEEVELFLHELNIQEMDVSTQSAKEVLTCMCQAIVAVTISEFGLEESLGSIVAAEREVYSVPSYAILRGNVMITGKAFDAMMEYDEDKTNTWISKCLLTLEKSEQKGEE